ncbi:hypothetical protein [Nocardia sp. IFM 10818]
MQSELNRLTRALLDRYTDAERATIAEALALLDRLSAADPSGSKGH